MHRKDELKRILKTCFGLLIFAFGEYLTIVGNVGLTPWDCVTMGLTNHIPLTFGQLHVAVALSIIVVDLLMKETIGAGTVLDALLVGPFVDMWTALLKFKDVRNWYIGIPVLIVGFFIMCVGQYFYMSAALSCGPRDTLLVAVGKRLPKLKIGLVDIIMKLCLIGIALLLSGPVGVGTVVAMVGMGIAIQLVFDAFHFEPRDIVHEDLITTIKNLVKS